MLIKVNGFFRRGKKSFRCFFEQPHFGFKIPFEGLPVSLEVVEKLVEVIGQNRFEKLAESFG